MKNIYTRPEIEITAISSADVITLSNVGALSKGSVTEIEKSVINF